MSSVEDWIEVNVRVDVQEYKNESGSFVDRICDVVMSPTCLRGAIHPKCPDRIFENSAIPVGSGIRFRGGKGILRNAV